MSFYFFSFLQNGRTGGKNRSCLAGGRRKLIPMRRGRKWGKGIGG
jgi:hypothetical protein